MSRHFGTVRYELTDAHNRLTSALPLIKTALAALEDAQPGYPTSGSGSSSDSSRTTDDAGHPGGLDKYLFRNDPAAHDLSNILIDAKAAHRAAIRLYDVLTRWAIAIGVEGNAKGTRAIVNGGDCLACSRFVSNSPTDRLRSGLCNACSKAWYIDPMNDRNDWIVKRRRNIGRDVMATGSQTRDTMGDTGVLDRH